MWGCLRSDGRGGEREPKKEGVTLKKEERQGAGRPNVCDRCPFCGTK